MYSNFFNLNYFTNVKLESISIKSGCADIKDLKAIDIDDILNINSFFINTELVKNINKTISLVNIKDKLLLVVSFENLNDFDKFIKEWFIYSIKKNKNLAELISQKLKFINELKKEKRDFFIVFYT